MIVTSGLQFVMHGFGFQNPFDRLAVVGVEILLVRHPCFAESFLRQYEILIDDVIK